MKKVIINADDLGADEGRNQGILEAAAAGAVTSASMLANGPAFSQAVLELLSMKPTAFSLGVHVNLSEGKPLCRGLRILVGPDGLFRGKAAAHDLLLRTSDSSLKKEISREVRAQIGLIREKGLPVSHIDGHQHVHVFPAAWSSVVQAALDHNIPWVRIPDEPVPPARENVPDALRAEGKRFSEMARAALPALKGLPLRRSDNFRGLFWKGRLSFELLEQCFKTLPAGITECMVHPGRAGTAKTTGPFSAFSTMERERELEVLLLPSVHSLLRNSGVTPVPFSESWT